MFRFENPHYFWLLVGIIPLGIFLYLANRWYQRQANRLGEELLISQISDTVPRKWQGLLVMWIFVNLVFALANPQWGSKREKVQTKSADIFIALDISNSMYCRDIAPSRLDQSKRLASQLINRLRGERIGLIFFAGSAYLQMPLTTDYAAALLFVQSASPELAGSQGTALGAAIQTALEGFNADTRHHRVLVIISDGEDHETEALEKSKLAQDQGMIIFTVGAGTSEGSFIPIVVRGGEDWKRDDQGQPVRTKLNETLLREMAISGGGTYFPIQETDQLLEEIDTKVATLEKREFEERSFTDYESYYQIFLGLAIVGLLLLWLFENPQWFEVSIKNKT